MSEESRSYRTDILIAGAGFAGSLAALALNRAGYEVMLLERDSHPRFTIGESSTPIADMVLRDLSKRYDLPWLYPLSRYGSWQKHYPDLVCGIKRGFSYYKHSSGTPFKSDGENANQLLVAASSDNESSDTQWMRSDVDAFLVRKVREEGITCLEQTEIVEGGRDRKWTIRARSKEGELTISADFLIDATGGAGLMDQLLGVSSSPEGLLTDSRAIYTHVEELPRWSKYLDALGISGDEYPYDPDWSALHHLLEEGWLWMLRFNDGRTSVGLVLDNHRYSGSPAQPDEKLFQEVISKYPSLETVLKYGKPAAEPGRMVGTGRMQRKMTRAAGDGWAALPHSAGFIDPLHSTGIAYTLCGVEKLVRILSEYRERNDPVLLQEQLSGYQRSLFLELELVDKLISGSYRAMPHFGLFHAWSMLYFTAAIHYEQTRLAGTIPDHFLMAGDERICEIVDRSLTELNEITAEKGGGISDGSVATFVDAIRERIEPYNSAGLLEPESRNMYRHTAAAL